MPLKSERVLRRPDNSLRPSVDLSRESAEERQTPGSGPVGGEQDPDSLRLDGGWEPAQRPRRAFMRSAMMGPGPIKRSAWN